VEDLSPDERMSLYLGGLPERVRAFIQTDVVYKPYENGDTAARRPATESADQRNYAASETVLAAEAAVRLELVRQRHRYANAGAREVKRQALRARLHAFTGVSRKKVGSALSEAKRARYRKENRCYLCHEVGHRMAQCPHRTEENAAAVFAAYAAAFENQEDPEGDGPEESSSSLTPMFARVNDVGTSYVILAQENRARIALSRLVYRLLYKRRYTSA